MRDPFAIAGILVRVNFDAFCAITTSGVNMKKLQQTLLKYG